MLASFFFARRRRAVGLDVLRAALRTSTGRARRRGSSRMVFLITSSLLGAINFIITTIQLRAPGMTFWRLPFFVWAQFVTAFLLLLAFPPLEAAAVLQLDGPPRRARASSCPPASW